MQQVIDSRQAVNRCAAPETPEEAHLRRLRATVERWERIARAYQRAGMTAHYRHALRTLDEARRALAGAV